MSKADNMLAILWLLKSRRKMTAKQLAEQLEIHIRTVYRCIDALCVSGVPIVSEPGREGGYSIPDSIKLEPLFFDAEEQKALLHAATFAREAGYPSEEALCRAVTKIKRFSNPDQLARMERRETRLEVIQPPSDPALRSALAEIETCMDLQLSFEVGYKTGYGDNVRRRTIDPYGLVHWKSKWYAVGYCHLRGEIRSFRVDRMSELSRTDSGFQRPPHFSAREFLLDSLIAESGQENEANPISVRIQGSSQALDDLCAHWLLGHALAERTMELAHFKLDELRLMQVAYYLLSYGGTIKIVEPRELKEYIADIAASLSDYHRD